MSSSSTDRGASDMSQSMSFADDYTPVIIAHKGLEMIQELTGLGIAPTIVLTTLLVRISLLPLSIFSERNSVRFATLVVPRFRDLHRRLTPASGKWDAVPAAEQGAVAPPGVATPRERMMAAYRQLFRELRSLYTEHQCHPLRTALSPLIQLPIFISLSLGVRKLVRTTDPAVLAEAGALWFRDLSACAMTGFFRVTSERRAPS
jgi:YidC/Oxa1 family membrane protein insertase